MKYLKLLLPLTLVMLFFTGCEDLGLLYKLMSSKSYFFTQKEKILVDQCAAKVGYLHEYDGELGLDFIVPVEKKDKTTRKDLAAFVELLDKTDRNDVIILYKKFYTLMVVMDFRMKSAKKVENWKDYTYLKKYLLPPMKDFFAIYEAYTLKKYPSVADDLDKKKKILKKRIEKIERKKRDAREESSPHCC